MIVAHRDAPVAHATLRIGNRNFRERLFRFFVFEGVKPRNGPIEFLLRLWRAGDWEVHGTEFLGRVVLVWMHLLRDSRSDECKNQAKCGGPGGKLHGRTPCWLARSIFTVKIVCQCVNVRPRVRGPDYL